MFAVLPFFSKLPEFKLSFDTFLVVLESCFICQNVWKYLVYNVSSFMKIALFVLEICCGIFITTTFLDTRVLLACYNIGLTTECISEKKKKTKVQKVELVRPMQQHNKLYFAIWLILHSYVIHMCNTCSMKYVHNFYVASVIL